MKLISIIIPVYNSEKSIRKCIDHIINQTYSNLEIILVDDGSYDNSGMICDEYAQKDKRIKVFHIENSGVSNARNIGLNNATGQYISFIDSDDFIEYSTYEECMKIIEKDDVDILKFAYAKKYKSYNKKYIFSTPTNQIIEKDEYNIKIYPNIFNSFDYSNITNAIIKKEIIKEERLLKSLKYAEDYLFMCTCILNSKKIYIYDKVFYYYMINEFSATQKMNKYKTLNKIENEITASKEILRKLKDLKINNYDNQCLNRIRESIIDNLKAVSCDTYNNYKDIIEFVLSKYYEYIHQSSYLKNICGRMKLFYYIKFRLHLNLKEFVKIIIRKISF